MLNDSRTIVMWNPTAGTAEAAAEVRDMLRAMPGVTIWEPDGREAAIEETVRAAGEGAELIVAAGGDGTISSIVEGLMRLEERPALGILPLGTGNDFARTLNIPLSPAEALHVLSTAAAREVDVVECTTSAGTRTYANMLTGGNTGRYLQHMTSEVKQMWGPFCYLRGVIDVIRDLQVYRIEVCFDDGSVDAFDALNIFVANGRFSGGGLAVSPEAKPDDGKVDVVIVADGDPGEIAALTSQYFLTDYLEHELIAFRRARRLTLTSQPAMSLTTDGDEVGETPLSVIVQERRLRVLVPSRASELN